MNLTQEEQAMIKKILLLALVGITVSACASTPEPEIIVKRELEKFTIIHPEPPSQVRWIDHDFLVYNRELLESLLRSTDKPIRLIAVTPDGYEAIVNNFQDLTRYIEQQKAIIMFYRSTVPSAIDDETETNQPLSLDPENQR